MGENVATQVRDARAGEAGTNGPKPGEIVAGIDVGGTLTDLILVDGRNGRVRMAKTPTTTHNQVFGVVAALAETGFSIGDIDLIVHGTTTTTNAVPERRLARSGMITTRGFRDVIEPGRRNGAAGAGAPCRSRWCARRSAGACRPPGCRASPKAR